MNSFNSSQRKSGIGTFLGLFFWGSCNNILAEKPSSDIRGLHRAKLSPFQKKFYAKLYRLRIVEQKRFVFGGAKYTEDLKRFHQLQDEYLLLVNNDIKDVVELVNFRSRQKEKMQYIEDRQKELYRESSSRKRCIKSEEQYREYQMWHVEVQEELDELK